MLVFSISYATKSIAKFREFSQKKRSDPTRWRQTFINTRLIAMLTRTDHLLVPFTTACSINNVNVGIVRRRRTTCPAED
jgi:hypothetical protein